jgi:predicted nuclease of predicted toxin-antitoxin system
VRLYLDENMSSAEAKSLRESGHDVFYVNELDRLKGISDAEHAENAQDDGRVLVTKDVDFGKLRHIDGIPSTGVVYIKPAAEREGNLATRLPEVIKAHESDLSCGAFVTVDADKTRARELESMRSGSQSQPRSPH